MTRKVMKFYSKCLNICWIFGVSMILKLWDFKSLEKLWDWQSVWGCDKKFLNVCPQSYLIIYIIYLHIYPSFYLSTSLFIVCLSSIHLSINAPISLSTHLPTHLSIQLSIYISIHVSLYLYNHACVSTNSKLRESTNKANHYRTEPSLLHRLQSSITPQFSVLQPEIERIKRLPFQRVRSEAINKKSSLTFAASSGVENTLRRIGTLFEVSHLRNLSLVAVPVMLF